MTHRHDDNTARQGRIAAVVIALAGVLAMLAPWIVAQTGIAPKYEILMYLVSMAAFIWSLAVTLKIWQKTRN
ncbi:DUF5337 domain-containing protein [Loktanella salsilacus]|jgi:hypothetical protein|uniref:Uncharacterized protein n=1 Tax=Loktanella salsilacus TaxID=195913 RepID=A0A1I4E7Q3_9RHOB|nr:DUF5337 domain-containing protein [Loktanella salsilacus]MBU0778627.1 DUF5337 domain-containing protein [Alphaproteobacteria bacterium]MBU0860878.1 DUF5337 domain-containing protein [Alphaproteobacteria bacterium]MBU1837271.1 DUF5337 domain-containing protein [Alphaproteobacteria bacterium]UTH43280.1 DUF5337 domain-containing protein [Loktanella salsilacus]UTH46986.1 DUF5337 domain-containing protein [Loktanella salsilacus]|tara:strand:+ start:501 stop:716 length:216 start_codon:yes stop_codon:yes gene_type:complete